MQPIAEKVAIPASMPAINLGVSQNAPPSVPQNAPMTDISPKFATPCCTASTQAQPIVQQQQQPQAQTFFGCSISNCSYSCGATTDHTQTL